MLYEKEKIENRLRMLSLMISKGILEIKVGFKCKRGKPLDPRWAKFHPKVMIFTDFEGNSIVTNGSPNESEGGGDRNEEAFDVFKSWDIGSKKWFDRHWAKFDEFWDNTKENVKTIEVSKLIESNVLRKYRSRSKTKGEMINIEKDLNKLLEMEKKVDQTEENIPKESGEIELRHYQMRLLIIGLKKTLKEFMHFVQEQVKVLLLFALLKDY